MGRVKELLNQKGPTIIHDIPAPKGRRQWQSGVFWIDWIEDSRSDFSKAVISWPLKCEALMMPLPDNIKTKEDALKYIREQIVAGLSPENGVDGP